VQRNIQPGVPVRLPAQHLPAHIQRPALRIQGHTVRLVDLHLLQRVQVTLQALCQNPSWQPSAKRHVYCIALHCTNGGFKPAGGEETSILECNNPNHELGHRTDDVTARGETSILECRRIQSKGWHGSKVGHGTLIIPQKQRSSERREPGDATTTCITPSSGFASDAIVSKSEPNARLITITVENGPALWW